MPTAGPADDAAIREQAYYFWEQDGRPDGRETEYWQRAVMALTDKAQLDMLTKPAPKKAAAKAKTVAKPPAVAKAPKKIAASKAKAAPAKAEAVKKPKKK